MGKERRREEPSLVKTLAKEVNKFSIRPLAFTPD